MASEGSGWAGQAVVCFVVLSVQMVCGKLELPLELQGCMGIIS